jgi:hypothetical protein
MEARRTVLISNTLFASIPVMVAQNSDDPSRPEISGEVPAESLRIPENVWLNY